MKNVALCIILIASYPGTGSLYVGLYFGCLLEIIHNNNKKMKPQNQFSDRDINSLKHLKEIIKIFSSIFRIYINNLMNEDSIGPVLIPKDTSWGNNLRFLKSSFLYNLNGKYKRNNPTNKLTCLVTIGNVDRIICFLLILYSNGNAVWSCVLIYVWYYFNILS